MYQKNKGGFTLVELLVVISIIGLLSSMSMVSVNIARERARDAVRKADAAQLRLALYLYFDDNLHFPVADMLPANAISNYINVLTPYLDGTCSTCNGVVYMRFVPNDPLNLPLPTDYLYGYNSDGKEFYLRYYLENEGPKDIHGY